MGFYKTEALVLRNREFNEADQLVTLLSPDYGKLRVIARGARKPKSRLRAGVQAFTLTNLLLHTGRSIDIITGTETGRCFYFREDLAKLTAAVYWADLLDRVLPEREPYPAVYSLLFSLLCLLEAAPSKIEDIRALDHLFELRLISSAGYAPDPANCLRCGEAVQNKEGKLWFNLEQGGVICNSCVLRAEAGILPVSRGTLALMQHWISMEVGQFWRVKGSAYNLQELDRLLPAYLEYHLEQKIPSVNLRDNLVRDF